MAEGKMRVGGGGGRSQRKNSKGRGREGGVRGEGKEAFGGEGRIEAIGGGEGGADSHVPVVTIDLDNKARKPLVVRILLAKGGGKYTLICTSTKTTMSVERV